MSGLTGSNSAETAADPAHPTNTSANIEPEKLLKTAWVLDTQAEAQAPILYKSQELGGGRFIRYSTVLYTGSCQI